MSEDRPLQETGDPYDTPEGWIKSRVGTLMEWIGDESATAKDIANLKEWDVPRNPHTGAPEGSNEADPSTLVGTLNRKWTSKYWSANRELASYYKDCPGGEGSMHYEYQKVGGEYNGVTFTKDPIWCYNSNNELVKEIPGNAGEHHAIDQGEGQKANYVGPEPGSEADKVLGDNAYTWNEDDVLYEII